MVKVKIDPTHDGVHVRIDPAEVAVPTHVEAPPPVHGDAFEHPAPPTSVAPAPAPIARWEDSPSHPIRREMLVTRPDTDQIQIRSRVDPSKNFQLRAATHGGMELEFPESNGRDVSSIRVTADTLSACLGIRIEDARRLHKDIEGDWDTTPEERTTKFLQYCEEARLGTLPARLKSLRVASAEGASLVAMASKPIAGTTLKQLAETVARISTPSDGEALRKLRSAAQKERMGLSSTISREDAEGRTAFLNFERTDRLVSELAARRTPMTQTSVLELIKTINQSLGEGLTNNHGEAGALRDISVTAGGEFEKRYAWFGDVDVMVDDLSKSVADGLQDIDRDPDPLNRKQKAIILASQANQRLVSIHPFSDANGRTSRALLDFIVQREGMLPPTMKEVNVAQFSGLSEQENPTATFALDKTIEGLAATYGLT